jgi:hypothetical protein
MACPQCQQDNPADAPFCNGCGSPLVLTCPSCNQPNPPASRFCNGCGQKLGETGAPAPAPRFAEPQGYTPKHLAEKILSSRSALEGERKLVTVMFADVSGFTSLSERLDPENVHGLMTRVFELILAEVHRYEGTVNQFLGDGVMALFGAPIAHEDHARRGVQAAHCMTSNAAIASEARSPSIVESRAKRVNSSQVGGPNGICHPVGQYLQFPLKGTAFRT